jgi:hypothetical protein
MMTPDEYVQFKAFARQDGALLALCWIASFAFYVYGTGSPMMMGLGLVAAICSPFFAAQRLRLFRDRARDGVISFRRSWAYYALIFFYAGILFALAQYLYFEFLDKGFMLSQVMQVWSSTEGQQMLKAYGLTETLKESIDMMAKLRPIDYALNDLTLTITLGLILGLPFGALMKRDQNMKQANNEPKK